MPATTFHVVLTRRAPQRRAGLEELLFKVAADSECQAIERLVESAMYRPNGQPIVDVTVQRPVRGLHAGRVLDQIQ